MQLITAELAQRLPAIGGARHQADPVVQVMFFYRDFFWRWYGIEYDGIDNFYGVISGDITGLGSFSLAKLQAMPCPNGRPLERDIYFKPCPLSELVEKLRWQP